MNCRNLPISLIGCRYSQLLLTIFVFYQLQIVVVQCIHLPDLYWNTSNPIFHRKNDTNTNTNETTTEFQLSVARMDSLTIHCPFINNESDIDNITDQLFIYRVSQSDFERCEIDPLSSSLIADCSSPRDRTNVRIVFRPYSPLPNGLEYLPGHVYYFISTSSGTPLDINQKINDLCVEQNMRLKIYVMARSTTKHDDFDDDLFDDAKEDDISAEQQNNQIIADMIFSPKHLPKLRPTFQQTTTMNEEKSSEQIDSALINRRNDIVNRDARKQPNINLNYNIDDGDQFDDRSHDRSATVRVLVADENRRSYPLIYRMSRPDAVSADDQRIDDDDEQDEDVDALQADHRSIIDIQSDQLDDIKLYEVHETYEGVGMHPIRERNIAIRLYQPMILLMMLSTAILFVFRL